MGNSQGNPKEDIVYDSRVIKISESVAKRIFVNPNEPATDSPRKKSSSGTAGFIDDPPIPRQHQPFREDGNYVDDSFFEEFRRNETVNELQLRSLHRKVEEAVSKFQEQQLIQKPFVESKEQKQLKECLRKNPNTSLKCHESVLEFALFSKQAATVS